MVTLMFTGVAEGDVVQFLGEGETAYHALAAGVAMADLLDVEEMLDVRVVDA